MYAHMETHKYTKNKYGIGQINKQSTFGKRNNNLTLQLQSLL